MEIGKTFLILGFVVILGALTLILYISKKETPQEELKINQEKPTVNKVGLWEDCDPQVNNCDTGLECKRYGDTDIYRCIEYLKEGEKCGVSVAKACSEGLTCVDTDKTRQRCGTFSTKGEQECFVEPFQVCKPL